MVCGLRWESEELKKFTRMVRSTTTFKKETPKKKDELQKPPLFASWL